MGRRSRGGLSLRKEKEAVDVQSEAETRDAGNTLTMFPVPDNSWTYDCLWIPRDIPHVSEVKSLLKCVYFHWFLLLEIQESHLTLPCVPSTALDSSSPKSPLKVDMIFSIHATAYLFWKNQKNLRRHSWTSLEPRLQCGVGAPDQVHLCKLWEPDVPEGLTLTSATGFFHGTQ